MKLRYFSSIFFLLLSSSSYAMFCPTNFKNINYGDSLDLVKQTCGLPTSQKVYNKNALSSEEWTYYVRTDLYNTATLKMKVVLQHDRLVNIHLDRNQSNRVACHPPGWGDNNGYTSSIQNQQNGYTSSIQNSCYSNSVHGEDVSVAYVCGGTLHLGDSAQMLRFLCGAPAVVKQNYVPNFENDDDQQTIELYYAGQARSPDVTLIFQNGRLKDRKFNG